MEGGSPLPLEPQYEIDYMVYGLAREKIVNKKYVEDNFNTEDFILWISLNAYNQKTIESNTKKT